MRSSDLTWLGASVYLLFTIPASATTLYSIVEIGTLPGYADTFASDINDRGEVVGLATNHQPYADRAFYWNNGIMTDISPGPNSTATGINNSGQVIGHYEPRDQNGYSMGIVGFILDGGTTVYLPQIGSAVYPMDINDNGWVTGNLTSWDYFTKLHAFVWDGQQMLDIGTLPGGDFDTYGLGINNSGQVVGRSACKAFSWEGGVMSELSSGSGSYAEAINSLGTIVGFSGGGTCSAGEALIWNSSGDATILGDRGPGFVSIPSAINDLGVVAGFSRDSSPYGVYATLWSPTDGIVDLQTEVLGPAGWAWSRAESINNLGQIVGIGQTIGTDGTLSLVKSFVLTPVPIPAAAWLFGGALSALGVLRRRTSGA